MKLLDLIWVDPTHKKTRSRLCVQESTRRRSKVRFKEFYPVLTCSLQMPLLEAVKVLVPIMMSVSLSNKGKPIEVETLRHQQNTFPRNSPETHLHQMSGRGSSDKISGAKTKSADWSTACTELRTLPTSGNSNM